MSVFVQLLLPPSSFFGTQACNMHLVTKKLFGSALQQANPDLTKILLLTSPFLRHPPNPLMSSFISNCQRPTTFPPHPRKGLTLWIALLHELGVAPTRPQCVTLKIMYAFLFGNCHKLYGMAQISICYLLLNFSKK